MAEVCRRYRTRRRAMRIRRRSDRRRWRRCRCPLRVRTRAGSAPSGGSACSVRAPLRRSQARARTTNTPRRPMSSVPRAQSHQPREPTAPVECRDVNPLAWRARLGTDHRSGPLDRIA
ncbi:hypothetical protein L1887_59699 [Cichorium endivia]|nr:hypothetical protein L1887_59699 [Cichorium endivia]